MANPAQPTVQPNVEVMRASLPGGPSGTGFVQPSATGQFVRALDNMGIPYESLATGLTAHAGGGQANGTAITAAINVFGTVASGGDSATLPSTQAGTRIGNNVGAGLAAKMVVINHTVTSMNLFPASGEQINNVGADTAFAVPANKSAIFYCTAVGQWEAILSA